MPRKHYVPILVAATICLFVCPRAQATTVVDMAQGESQFVKVSGKDLNRIVVPQENPKVFTASQALDIKIEGNQVFVRAQEGLTTAELFIVANERAYSLILVSADIPAQTIVIRDPGEDGKKAASWEKEHDYVVTVKHLIKALAAETVPEGYEVIDPEPEGEKYIVKSCSLALAKKYRGFHLSGLVFTLENPGKENVTFTENEFYQPGVLAVSIEKQTLLPGEKTRAYIVREAAKGGQS